jgi:hypothetical protein
LISSAKLGTLEINDPIWPIYPGSKVNRWGEVMLISVSPDHVVGAHRALSKYLCVDLLSTPGVD